jgi:lipid II:glycine glycyltransferase (peptidoglycan interpeptide bridge formation enzyme)
MRIKPSTLTREEWNTLIKSAPNLHILQSWEWGQIKSNFGWQSLRYEWRDQADRIKATALVLKRRLLSKTPFAGLSVLYVPKGPLLWDWDNFDVRECVFHDLSRIAGQQKSIFIKVDPDVPIGFGVPDEQSSEPNPLGYKVVSELENSGWRYSDEQIQFRNTVWIDLSPSEDQLLARMKQKTRYNIRLAKRRGVKIRIGEIADLDSLYHMYAETSVRDGFVIRNQDYYLELWKTYMNAGVAVPLIAEVEGDGVAGLILFHFGSKAWYLYGMSSLKHREKMPNYLLQWEAIKIAKTYGCRTYDLWGAPDEFNDQDPMWGVFRFKSGLGGEVVRYIGAYDLPVQPISYQVYTQILPKVLKLMRKRGKAITENGLRG